MLIIKSWSNTSALALYNCHNVITGISHKLPLRAAPLSLHFHDVAARGAHQHGVSSVSVCRCDSTFINARRLPARVQLQALNPTAVEAVLPVALGPGSSSVTVSTATTSRCKWCCSEPFSSLVGALLILNSSLTTRPASFCSIRHNDGEYEASQQR